MARGPGAGWGGGWAEAGGAWRVVGVSVLPQGWVSSPATSLAVCRVKGAAPARGGLFPSPSPWQGPVTPGRARSWRGTCPAGLCWEPLTLPLTPGLCSRSARVSTVP